MSILVVSLVIKMMDSGRRYSYDASRSVMEDYNLVVKNASIMKVYMNDLPADINAEGCTKPGGGLQAVSLQYASYQPTF